MSFPEDNNGIAENSLRQLKGFSIASFFVTLVRFGIRLIKNVIITRILGPKERGVFSLLTTIPSLIVSMGNLGFGIGNIYLVGKKNYDLRKVLSNTFLVTALLGIFLIGVGYFLMSFEGLLKGDASLLRSLSPLVLIMVPVILLHAYCRDLLIATKKIHFLNKLGLCISLFPCIILPGLWLLTGQTLSSAMYTWALSTLAVTIGSVLKLISLCDFKFQISPTYIKESLHFGRRGLIGIFAGTLVRKVDYIFISTMLGATQLGYYAISISIGEIIISLQTAVTMPYMPIRFGLETKEASRVTPIAIRHAVFFSICISLFMVVCGKPLIQILFGESFLPAYQPILILLPGVIAICIHDFIKSDFYSHNLPQFVSKVAVYSLLCHIGLNLLLIPAYGINGAALSSSISYALAMIIMLRKFHANTGLSYKEILVIKKSELVGMIKLLKTFAQTIKSGK